MSRKKHPDHAGRLPSDHRYGNPSDPNEEADRIRKAYENVDNWQKKYGSEISGAVKMSYGAGPTYEVTIGDKQIAQKVTSRPITSTAPLGRSLPEPAESAPEPPPLPPTVPRQFWLWRLINRITGTHR